MPNLWVPPHRETVRRPAVVTPPVVHTPRPIAEVPVALRLTRWDAERAAGRAGAVDEGRPEVPVPGLGRKVEPAPLPYRSFNVGSHVPDVPKSMCDGLLYGRGAELYATTATVAGTTWNGIQIFNRAAALPKVDDVWQVPMSTFMSPLGFAIFRDVLSARGAITTDDNVISLWIEAVRDVGSRLWILDDLAAGAEPAGRTHHRSSIDRVLRTVKDRGEIALYVQTMRLVHAETTRNLQTILMDDWPEDWHVDSQGVLENP